VFPPGRYGRRRAPRRRWRGAGTVALLTVIGVTLALAIGLYRRYGDRSYEPEVVGFSEITDRQIMIRFRVRLPAGEGAVCAVRARSRAGIVVGRAEVPVPAGATEVSYRLATTDRPFVGEVPGCRRAG
jgi:hypothetical protein